MIVLVDTSVWIEYLRGTDVPEARALHRLLDQESDLCVCGPVLAEVLEGIRDDKQHARTKAGLESLLYLPLRKQQYVEKEAKDLASMGELVATSLHPLIDPSRCIGSGACIVACPEKTVIGLIGGHARLVQIRSRESVTAPASRPVP